MKTVCEVLDRMFRESANFKIVNTLITLNDERKRGIHYPKQEEKFKLLKENIKAMDYWNKRYDECHIQALEGKLNLDYLSEIKIK